MALDRSPRFTASHLGLFCLPISHKNHVLLICVNSLLTLKPVHINEKNVIKIFNDFAVTEIKKRLTRHLDGVLQGTFMLKQSVYNVLAGRH